MDTSRKVMLQGREGRNLAQSVLNSQTEKPLYNLIMSHYFKVSINKDCIFYFMLHIAINMCWRGKSLSIAKIFHLRFYETTCGLKTDLLVPKGQSYIIGLTVSNY